MLFARHLFVFLHKPQKCWFSLKLDVHTYNIKMYAPNFCLIFSHFKIFFSRAGARALGSTNGFPVTCTITILLYCFLYHTTSIYIQKFAWIFKKCWMVDLFPVHTFVFRFWNSRVRDVTASAELEVEYIAKQKSQWSQKNRLAHSLVRKS